eukprot:333054-Chlamydomonas_euryale.AAC.4
MHRTTPPAQVRTIQELSRRPDVLQLLANSLAPSIYGHDVIKRGLVLQVWGLGVDAGVGQTVWTGVWVRVFAGMDRRGASGGMRQHTRESLRAHE